MGPRLRRRDKGSRSFRRGTRAGKLLATSGGARQGRGVPVAEHGARRDCPDQCGDAAELCGAVALRMQARKPLVARVPPVERDVLTTLSLGAQLRDPASRLLLALLRAGTERGCRLCGRYPRSQSAQQQSRSGSSASRRHPPGTAAAASRPHQVNRPIARPGTTRVGSPPPRRARNVSMSSRARARSARAAGRSPAAALQRARSERASTRASG